MSGVTRKSRRSDSSDGLGSTRLELERSADVYRLAVAAVVLQRRRPITLDIVANAAGQGDAVREVVRRSGVERYIVAAAERSNRVAGRPFGADGDAGAELAAERIADAE